MSTQDNPYRSGPDLDAVEAKVKVPAVFLIIIGLINLLVGIYFLGTSLLALQRPLEDRVKDMETAWKDLNPDQRKQMNDLGWTPEVLADTGVKINLGLGVATVLPALLTLIGGIRMLSLRSRGLAIAGSIFAAVPCLSPLSCCLIGIGVGVWGLVVLLDSQVGAAFASRAREGSEPPLGTSEEDDYRR